MRMAGKGLLNLKSLKNQDYEYLWGQLENGQRCPGTVFNIEEMNERCALFLSSPGKIQKMALQKGCGSL